MRLLILKNCTCGPAQRTMIKVVFDDFSWVVDPPGPNQDKMGAEVLMMFLYEARAPRTGTSSAQLGPHCGQFSSKLEGAGPSKPQKRPS